jgi:hypothetical protein
MKRILIVAITLAVFTSSCDSFNNKIGVKCDDKHAVRLVEKLLTLKNNNTVAVKVVVDRNNIVEWDYKDGRYLCRAKVKGYVENATYGDLLWLSEHGLKLKDNGTLEGWVYYQTFFPTVDRKKFEKGEGGHFWVELLKTNEVPVW